MTSIADTFSSTDASHWALERGQHRPTSELGAAIMLGYRRAIHGPALALTWSCDKMIAGDHDGEFF